MRISTIYIFSILSILFFASCSGIRYLSIETREPAQVTLPATIKKILVVNNVVNQADEIGHDIKRLNKKHFERINVSSDSVPIFFTESLTQFLEEEGYFDEVKYHEKPLRDDKDFWQEKPLSPETMIELRNENHVDAIISLDKLVVQTSRTDFMQQEGYYYGAMTGKIQSIIRVYLPSMEGKIPAVQFNDSLKWEGFDIQDSYAYAEKILPTYQEALKELAVYSAEKMTYVFSPHWEYQDRWYYTPMNSKMREGEVYAKDNQWYKAIEKWEEYYSKEKNKLNRAKAAHNIALGYEMMDDMTSALEWATISADLFSLSTSTNSLDRRRATVYKNEIDRRKDSSNKLNMQLY